MTVAFVTDEPLTKEDKEILKNLSEDIEWTRRLGRGKLADYLEQLKRDFLKTKKNVYYYCDY